MDAGEEMWPEASSGVQLLRLHQWRLKMDPEQMELSVFPLVSFQTNPKDANLIKTRQKVRRQTSTREERRKRRRRRKTAGGEGKGEEEERREAEEEKGERRGGGGRT